ncbi:helix-turn-helix domain-containing protein [Rhodococcus hoagii]|nr:helix-turn-helix domain-containing protein [Prescottella equi]NKV32832.1 helix-turn-helix domain-containing protein [Prescottella equi]
MESRPSAKRATFAERLRTLVDTVHPPGRGRFTQAEISEGVRELGGDLSQQYLSQLLRGVHEPSDRIVRHLAAFFGVSMDYFVDDEEYERTNDYIALLRRVGDSEVLAVSARAVDLPAEAIERISAAIEEERRRAGLTD